MSARSGRRLGCLGLAYALVLAFFTLLGAGGLWWLEPRWLTRLMPWRAEPYAPDVVFLPAGKDDTPVVVADEPPPEPAAPVVAPFGTVSAPITPTSGATLETPEGARVALPAGAVGETTEVRLAPVLAVPRVMDARAAGPVYDLQIGGHESYTFRRPVTITLPYLEELGDGAELAIGTWEEGRWRTLPTRVDRGAHTATAELRHASLKALLTLSVPASVSIPVITIAAGGGAAWLYSGTVRGAGYSLAYLGSTSYKTPNFNIHYYTEGAHAVLTDRGWRRYHPGATGGGEHPLFVVDVGTWLEQSFATLPKVDMQIEAARRVRYDVFLLALGAGDLGVTAPGGPIFLNCTIAQYYEAASNQTEMTRVIRSTVAHELVHLAQGYRFGNALSMLSQSNLQAWWFETSAEYLSEKILQALGERGSTVADLAIEAKHHQRLTERPLDTSKKTDNYAYAGLLRHMDLVETDAGRAFVKAVNQGGSASLTEVDGHAGGLADRFVAFVQDYVRDDLWSCQRYPNLHPPGTSTVHQSAAQSWAGAGSFIALTRGGSGGPTIRAWEGTVVGSLPHLTARALIMQAQVLPKARRAKLVLKAESSSRPQVDLLVAADRVGPALPAAGQPAPFQSLALDGGSSVTVFDDINTAGGHDRVTLLVVNRSLTSKSRGVLSLERWLLMPPEWVHSERDRPDEPVWTVTWERSELADYPQVFRGYNVYRRKVGDTSFPDAPINEEILTTEVYTDRPGNMEDYVHTVRVVDKHDNLSHPTLIDEEDPFQGRWRGLVRLTEGSVVDPLVKMVRSWYDDPDGPEASRAVESIREIVGPFDEAFRLVGLPLSFEIERRNGHYSLEKARLHVPGVEPDDEVVPLKQVGRHTVTTEEPPEDDLPPVYLVVEEPDVIRGSYRVAAPDGTYAVEWTFKRIQKPSAGSPGGE